MEIDIVGEDAITQAIIERLILEYRDDLVVKNRLPARGGQIQKLAPKFNALGTPVFLLTDLDQYHCPPELIQDWFEKDLNDSFLFRIAQEEAETWLMADKEGFSKWLGTDIDLIPETRIIDKVKGIQEIIFPWKPSLYMMLKIASQSKKEVIRKGLTPLRGASKGPMYNSTLVPYVHSHWNTAKAAENSYSLRKCIERLTTFGK